MKVFLLLLTIFIVNVWCKQRCYPISDVTPKPPPSVIISNEECPNPLDYVEKFDVEAAKGDWYYVEAYPSIYFQGLSCYRQSFIPSGPSKYTKRYCEKFNGTNSCLEAVMNHVDRDGKFRFELEDESAGFGYFLDIDYDNYYIMYLCDDLPNGKSQRSLFIASRTTTLSDALLDEAYGKIKAAGLGVDALETVNQDEEFCKPTPKIITVDGTCPTPNYVTSMDLDRFAGRWYIVSGYPSVYFAGLSCYDQRILPAGGRSYNQTFCEKYDGTVNCTLAKMNSYANDGKFNYTLPFEQGDGAYLYIDYQKYAILYVCVELENGKSRVSIWIMSRTLILSDADLKEAYGIIEANGFNTDDLRMINQDEEYCGRKPAVLSAEACPAPNPVASFDVERAAGKWYPVEGYPSVYVNGLDCYDLTFDVTGPNEYIDTYCEKYNGTVSCTSITLKHVNNDGTANFVVDGRDIDESIYFIYIDYESYFIFYVCQDLADGKTQRSLWIASRTPILSDELRNEAYQKIEEAGLDVDPLQAIRQDEEFCDLLPNVVISSEDCPTPIYTPTFNASAAAGKWYFVEVYPSVYFNGLDCLYANFVPTGEYTYEDTFCERWNGEKKCTKVAFDHINQDGLWTYDFFNPILNIYEDKGKGYYLHIDYENYFIFYLCETLERGQIRRNIYVGSRTRTLSDALLQEVSAKIEELGFDVDALETVNQDRLLCEGFQ